MDAPVSIVVINFGNAGLVRNLLASLSRHDDRRLVREVIIVDNGFPETGDSRSAISPSEYPLPIEFVQNSQRSYASGINRGAEASSGEVLVAANNDIEWRAEPGLRPLLETLDSDSRIGIVGPQLVFPDGRWQRSHGRFPALRRAVEALFLIENVRNAIASRRFATRKAGTPPQRVDYIAGAFMAIRRSCFEALGGFNEQYEFYGEEPDFSWRARQGGWTSVFVPAARIMHVSGASSSVGEPQAFARKGLAARGKFVADRSGTAAARFYIRLQQVQALQLAGLYRMMALAFPTRFWKQRAAAAAASARAAITFRRARAEDSDTGSGHEWR